MSEFSESYAFTRRVLLDTKGRPVKQTPEELGREQWRENRDWLDTLIGRNMHGILHGDYAEVAALHRALAGVMRRMQQREIDSQPDT